MFLIAAICLLLLAAWLFLNALNEMRWVEAHSHDETVAADKGFLPDVPKMLGVEGGYKGLADQTGSRIKESATQVQAKTADLSARVKERAKDENDVVGRTVAMTKQASGKVAEKGGEWGHKAVEKGSELGHIAAEKSGPLRQKVAEKSSPVLGKVAEKSSEISGKVKDRLM